jgi:hypothetical protein
MNPILVVGPLALLIPLLVTLIVWGVARREGTRATMGRLALLVAATAAALGGFFFVREGWFVFPASLTLFAFFAVPVLSGLEAKVAAEAVVEPVRSAGLTPRSVRSYVSAGARAIAWLLALNALAWAIWRIAAGAPSLLTGGFMFAGVTFFGLYEAWMREEVLSVRAADDERRVRVRAIFFAQATLTIAFFVLAGLSAGAVPGRIVLAVVAAMLGSAGCAFAMSTGIQKRYVEARRVRHTS